MPGKPKPLLGTYHYLYFMIQTTTTKKSKTRKSTCYIPKFYELFLTPLSGQYRIIGEKVYITPLLRTIISNMSTIVPKGQESLARTIKERTCSNSRLLLKYGSMSGTTCKINNVDYIQCNLNIERVDGDRIRIMNDKQWLTKNN